MRARGGIALDYRGPALPTSSVCSERISAPGHVHRGPGVYLQTRDSVAASLHDSNLVLPERDSGNSTLPPNSTLMGFGKGAFMVRSVPVTRTVPAQKNPYNSL